MAQPNRSLVEGFIQQVGGGLRRFFARAPETVAADLRRGGAPSSDRAGLPYNIVSQFGGDGLAEHLRIDQDLMARYADYEEMDEYPEISSAYDIYADDSTMPDMEEGKSIWVASESDAVAKELDQVLHKRVMIEDDIWGIARSVGKYGNGYGELLVAEQGLVGINYLPAATMRRVEDPKGKLLGFIQDVRGEFNVSLEDFYQLAKEQAQGGAGRARGRGPGEVTVFEDWEVVHWRLRGKNLRSVYGHGVADPARWIWKRLALLEDAILVYKLSRAPARYAFYVDVGELDNVRGLAYVNQVKNGFIKKKFMNPQTGKLDMRHNPLCLAGDTEVRFLDGTVKTIAEAAAALERGEEQWVWTTDPSDSGRTRPGKVHWAGKTRRNAQFVRVTLDNGKSVRVTPDHKMIRRDGQEVQAQHLLAGDSLMPFRRRISDKKKGDSLDGYEMIYCPKAGRSLYGHRLVADEFGLRTSGPLIHHKNFDKLNNNPSNLVGMDPRDHLALHRTLVRPNIGRAVAEARSLDPELDAKIKAACSKNITAYNQSESKRKQTALLNRERDQGRFIREYNASAKHTEDNVARSVGMSAYWSRPGTREAASESARLMFPTGFIEGVASLVRANPDLGADGIARLASGLSDLPFSGRRGKVRSVHRHMLLRAFREHGHAGFSSFRQAATADNHKVVSIEWLEEREDAYCLTVTPTHTFGIEAGVMVKNSMDEDFWVPSRAGKDSTRIEVLQGPDYAEVETLEYHRDKLVAGIKVPKAYLGYGGEATRASLSSEDIRFARTVMRIQREIRSGIRRACRVHLVAIGADADKAEFEIMMSVPSAILELAKLEVLSATADVATRMGEQVSTRWILTKLYKFSETEAERLMQERMDETLARGEIDAEVQGMLMQAQNAAQPAEEEPAEGEEQVASARPPKGPRLVERGKRGGGKRISELMKARRLNWEQEFNGGPKTKYAEDKLAKILQNDRELGRRLKGMEGLLADVRQGLRR